MMDAKEEFYTEKLNQVKAELHETKQGMGQMIGEIYRMIDCHWHEGTQWVEVGGDEKQIPAVMYDARAMDVRQCRGCPVIRYVVKGARITHTDGHKPSAADETLAYLDKGNKRKDEK